MHCEQKIIAHQLNSGQRACSQTLQQTTHLSTMCLGKIPTATILAQHGIQTLPTLDDEEFPAVAVEPPQLILTL